MWQDGPGRNLFFTDSSQRKRIIIDERWEGGLVWLHIRSRDLMNEEEVSGVGELDNGGKSST